MKHFFSTQRDFIVLLITLVIVTATMFYPVFLSNKIPMAANLLASFYNPWAKQSFPGWTGGIPNKPTGIDDIRLFYPLRNFTIHMQKDFEIPFWNPYVFSGNYQLGQSETAVFYPLFALFLILPQITAWILLIMIEPILVGIGMFLFLRLILQDKRAIFFGSIVLAFSGVVIVRMVEGLSEGHALLWMPFVFYGVEGFLQKRKVRYLYVIAASLVCSILAGWFQFTFYVFMFPLLYAIFRIFFGHERKLPTDFFVFSPFVFAPFLSLFHILPALRALFDSPRGTQVEKSLLDNHLMPLQHILSYVIPDLWGNPGSYNYFGKSEYKESIAYIGFVPFFLSVFSLSKRPDKKVLFFSIAAVASFFLGVDSILTRVFLQLPIPIVSSFLPNRIFLLTTFSLATLSAFGMQMLLREYKDLSWSRVRMPFLVIGCMILLVDVYLFLSIDVSLLLKYHVWHGSQRLLLQQFQNTLAFIGLLKKPVFLMTQLRNSIFSNALFVLLLVLFFFRKKIFSQFSFFLALTVVTLLSQIYFGIKYLPFSYREFLYPANPLFSYLQQNQGLNRFITLGNGHVIADFPLMFRLYSPDGVNAMYPRRYGELVTYVKNGGGTLQNIPRVEADLNLSSKTVFLDSQSLIRRFMQIDGIKYVAKLKNESEDRNGYSIEGTPQFKLVWQNPTWQVFRYNDVLPRYFLTTHYIVEPSNQTMLKTLFDSEHDPKAIVLEKDPNIHPNQQTGGSVQLVSYTPNHIQFKTNSKTDSLLYLSDTYTSAFRALVDNKDAPILRANYAFRAVALPKGMHNVLLYYSTDDVSYGSLIAILVLVGCLITTSFLVVKGKLLW